jgi:hypothetical protein
MAFGAVSDLWFMILLTRAVGPSESPSASLPLAASLGAGFITAVGLFAFGAALNDVLDARRDSAFSPERPIPAGRIRVSQAIVVVAGSLMIAVLGGAALGQTALLLTVLTSSGILFYNTAAKYIPAAGFIVLGLIHAVHMMIPDSTPPTVLPVALVMTHAMVIGGLAYWLEDKRPRTSKRALILSCVGWAFWMGVLISWGASRDALWPRAVDPVRIVFPFLAVASFAMIAWWKASRVSGRSAAEKLRRYGAMWQSLYGAAWLVALGLHDEAAWLGAFALAGFTAMTLIKEINGLTGRPIGYRA